MEPLVSLISSLELVTLFTQEPNALGLIILGWCLLLEWNL